ncbi:Hsp20/alpha crystallin family protein [Cohnella caldifontis]|uniref:Hsp20/alpha crystallin family protein n=1 Tax=Cohnella caldifontis TaxID=3027471 RepID=UPI0023ECBE31|nr:Hsp20/alpha crystallin family protein [Cohnella sp. YIM B05605]
MNSDKINRWLELARSFTGNDFWSDMFSGTPGSAEAAGESPVWEGKPMGKRPLFPAADVLTSDTEVLVIVDLPGVAKEDIHLSVGDEVLYIKGEAKALFPQHVPVNSERFTGSFERPIGLPVKIDGSNAAIRATFRQGTLIVRIPLPPAWKKTIPID